MGTTLNCLVSNGNSDPHCGCKSKITYMLVVCLNVSLVKEQKLNSNATFKLVDNIQMKNCKTSPFLICLPFLMGKMGQKKNKCKEQFKKVSAALHMHKLY